MPRRFTTLAAVILVLLATATPALAKKKHQNEEGAWNLKVTPDATAVAEGEKAFNDTLVLQQGFLRSRYSTDQHAFGTGPYTVHGSEISAQIKSDYEGKMDWSGLWNEDSIAGRVTWTTRDGKVMTFTFSGTRAPVEKAKKHR